MVTRGLLRTTMQRSDVLRLLYSSVIVVMISSAHGLQGDHHPKTF
jgi:hypothetical protein